MITRALCLLLVAGTVGAQAPAKKAAPASVMSDVRQLWTQSTEYLARSAAAVPDSLYSFRPTAAVRTFGQLIGHVAGTQNLLCAVSLGEKTLPAEDEIEKSATTKAALVQALAASNAKCTRAYAQVDAAVGGIVDVFGRPGTRRSALMLNATHNFEHYGNVITYMRMNGMVPPSSQQ
ncbi:MAG: DinB family protein [Gemmatimonadaceae bacterium]